MLYYVHMYSGLLMLKVWTADSDTLYWSSMYTVCISIRFNRQFTLSFFIHIRYEPSLPDSELVVYALEELQ